MQPYLVRWMLRRLFLGQRSAPENSHSYYNVQSQVTDKLSNPCVWQNIEPMRRVYLSLNIHDAITRSNFLLFSSSFLYGNGMLYSQNPCRERNEKGLRKDHPFCLIKPEDFALLPLHQEPGQTRVLPWSKPG